MLFDRFGPKQIGIILLIIIVFFYLVTNSDMKNLNLKTVTLLVFSMMATPVVCGQKSGELKIISGEVLDSLKQPVKGARIYLDNVKTSVVTDKHGNYKIEVGTDAERIMIVSPVSGADTSGIGERTKIDFTLSVTLLPYADSLVNSGKGKVKKKGNDSNVASTANKRFSSYSSMYDMIRGELPNVVVRGTSVYAQGKATFGGDSEVLFVVDGIIAEQVGDVSPLDVNTIELLKGPAAAGYGMQGANGVILITTKRGGDKK
jgi:TonB-dependent SusC/RagA subfamily outer membrane receptor